MPYLGPYAILAILVCCIIFGLIFLAVTVGWWGHRQAIRKGRVCAKCGYWGKEVDILIHETLDHWEGGNDLPIDGQR